TSNDEKKAEILFNTAMIYLENDDFDSALSDLKKAYKYTSNGGVKFVIEKRIISLESRRKGRQDSN
ncbi:MAG: tetratricopeptide repeat protein, partial [Calditrichia bacterium]